MTRDSSLPQPFIDWFARRGWRPRAHQLAMVESYRAGKSALLIAPTGAGKTLAGFLPSMVELHEQSFKGLHTIYISPLKALATDIQRNLTAPIEEMGLDIRLDTRTGDTSSSRRVQQMKKPPHILLTTPESLELMLSYPGATEMMAGLKRVIVDEVHAIAPGKRGQLLALCLSQLRVLSPQLCVCGLSATVAKPEELAAWLGDAVIIRAPEAVPPVIEIFERTSRVPWSGYTAAYAVKDIYEAIKKRTTSIVFVNTRAQAELLFQRLWEVNEDKLPIALHHGSLEREHRQRVEQMMSDGSLRAIVATGSLDLGLDWGAVDLVIQVGAPKGISRLLQRIGRSNHRLDSPSEALLVPCNRFELIECIAVIDAIREGRIDGETMREGSLDVLAQFILNCACAGGFDVAQLYAQVNGTYPYRYLTRQQFDDAVRFVADGGYALRAYDRYARMTQDETGNWHATPVAAKRHRMNIGTIVEYDSLRVTMRSKGSRRSRDLGQVEEYFVQGLLPGDTFFFAGQLVRYKTIRDNKVEVEPAEGERPKIPSYRGGRMPISESLAEQVLEHIADESGWPRFPAFVREWLAMHKRRSVLPQPGSVLVETFPHHGLHHVIVYSFAGRNANQTLGLLLTQRMEAQKLLPLGFAANDYMLNLWGLKPLTDPAAIITEALGQEQTGHWIAASQMAKRAFRNIAVIAGLVERNLPGARKTGRQVTISTDLIYDVLRKYDPEHLLLRATLEDVSHSLADIDRLRDSMAGKPIVAQHLTRVSPLAVPLMAELGIEKIRGEAETELLRQQGMQEEAERLWAEASS